MKEINYVLAFIMFCMAAVLCVILWALDMLDMILAITGAALFFILGIALLIDWKGGK